MKHCFVRQSKDTRRKQREAYVVTTKGHINSSSSNSSSNFDRDIYAFMAPSRQFHTQSINFDNVAHLSMRST